MNKEVIATSTLLVAAVGAIVTFSASDDRSSKELQEPMATNRYNLLSTSNTDSKKPDSYIPALYTKSSDSKEPYFTQKRSDTNRDDNYIASSKEYNEEYSYIDETDEANMTVETNNSVIAILSSSSNRQKGLKDSDKKSEKREDNTTKDVDDSTLVALDSYDSDGNSSKVSSKEESLEVDREGVVTYAIDEYALSSNTVSDKELDLELRSRLGDEPDFLDYNSTYNDAYGEDYKNQDSNGSRDIVSNYCKKDSSLSQGNWAFKYHITSSDGLEIFDLKYKNRSVAKSLKVVDWHISYRSKALFKEDTNSSNFIEGRELVYKKIDDNHYIFGHTISMGCPTFASSAVSAYHQPTINPIIQSGKEVGFYMVQDFKDPNWPALSSYRFQNKFEFYNNGAFRVIAINLGQGYPQNSTYRPIIRVDIDVNSKYNNFYQYKDNNWQNWQLESSYKSDLSQPLYKDKYLYKISDTIDKNIGYYVEPNRGQHSDDSQGDSESIYITRFNNSEGVDDMSSLGSCCELDKTGIEEFIKDPEIVGESDIVVWYVPTAYGNSHDGQEYCWADNVTDATGNVEQRVWPCIVGPKFVPISN